jgi:F0F1-type ATP synthase epsilon subunit
MLNNEMTILAASAVAAENLTESDAQAEFNAAAAKAAEAHGPDLERATVAKRKAEIKLALARRFKSN